MHGLPSFFPPTVGAGPDEHADELGDATADVNAAAAAASERDVRMPAPLSDADLQALLHDREAFLAGDAGRRLRSGMQADVDALIAFAQRRCAPEVVGALQSFHAKLGSTTFFDRVWAELLITGRLHLAAIAHAMADAEIPERQRTEALVEVARATGRCGVGFDQELERIRQALTLHAKGLRKACVRMREQQRNAWIEEACQSKCPPDPLQLDLGTHMALAIRQRLSVGSALPVIALAGHEALLDRLTAHCRSVITREVSPDAIARALADECLAQARDTLREKVGVAPDFSGDSPGHMKALERILDTLSERYGRLRALSFLAFDDDAIPVLASDAALVAIDIRDQMAHSRLAPAADDRMIVATGEGADRLELREHSERLWYIVAGDPALRERHPVRAEHLRRLAAVPETLAGLGAKRPLGLVATDLDAWVEALLTAHARHVPAQLSIDWLANPALARRFGEGLSTAGFSDFVCGLDVTPEDDTTLETFLHILSARPDPVALLRQLDYLRPLLLDALRPKIGQAHWHSVLHNGPIDDAKASDPATAADP
jgi:hypothetical protein